MDKTNAMRFLDRKKLAYRVHTVQGGAHSAAEVASLLSQPPARIYQTLVPVGKSGGHYVFLLPAEAELYLKKAAAVVGEKSVAMLPQKELLPLTGYVHGGCSPLGMKKQLPTVVQQQAQALETIFFSAGRIGLQIETAPQSLAALIPLQYADVAVG